MQPSPNNRSSDQAKRTSRARLGLATGAMKVQRIGLTTWRVTNGDGLPYDIAETAAGWTCTCLDWQQHCQGHGLNCKHIEAARLATQPSTPEPEVPAPLQGEHTRMDEVIQNIVARLAAPFPAAAINWKPQALTKDKTRAMAVAYIDARDVMARLDDVIGPFNWQVKHEQAGDQTVTGLGLKHPVTGEWVWKYDVGFVGGSESKDDDEQMKAVKGTASDGLKRAAVTWGIGRYLYALPKVWVEFDNDKRQLKTTPILPSWALPEDERLRRSKPAPTTQPDPAGNGGHPVEAKAGAQPPATGQPPARNGNGNGHGPAKSAAVPDGLSEARAIVMTMGSDAIKGRPLGELDHTVWDYLATGHFTGPEGLALQKAARVLLASLPAAAPVHS